jgi:bacterial/archaeal transporter family-2 protein
VSSPRLSRAVASGAALAVGALVAVQARVNGNLAEHLGGGSRGGVQAALVSFLVGLALATVAVVCFRRLRAAVASVVPAVRAGDLRWWQCAGGLCGALLIVSQAGTVPVLGVAVFTVSVVAGQTGAGLLVDWAGLGPGGPQPVTGRRLVAAVLAMAAVAVSVSGRLGSTGLSVPLVLLCVVGGAAVSLQTALNGQVGRVSGAALAAAWLSFLVGAVALAVLVAALGYWHPLPGQLVLYTGGPMGLVFVAVCAAVVPVTGVLVATLATVSGQVLGAVLLDALAPVPGTSLQTVTVLGAAMTLVAVVVGSGVRRPR